MSWSGRTLALGLALIAAAVFLMINTLGPAPASAMPQRAFEAMGITRVGAGAVGPAHLAIMEPAEEIVRFDVPAGMRSQLSEQDLDEQLRDWLLFGIVHRHVHDAESLRNILFDLPPVRYGHLEAVSTFEFGPTRGRFIGDGTAVALVAATTDRAVRIDQIAHVADAVRRDLGEPFQTLIPYEYELDPDRGQARLRRLPPIPYTALFSPAYGYRERSVGDQASLRAFLGETDDLVLARIDGDTLVFGGRKRQAGRALGVTLEDLAAIANGADSQQALGFSLDPDYDFKQIGEKLKQFEQIEWGNTLSPTTQAAIRRLCPSLPADYSLGVAFEFILQKPRDLRAEIRKAREGIEASKQVPLLELIDSLEHLRKPDPRASLLKCITQTGQFQAARYDGRLQGTEVGMTLFYTDLMAKLWYINYHGGAPVQQVKGFTTGYNFRLEPIYRAESLELPAARLWFGPYSGGYGLGSDGRSLFFGRLSTRLYSAGSNPLRPGDEVQTSRRMNAATHWWNDHYEAVADYEPQYQRLNQIMKWSLLVGWLRDQPSEAPTLPLQNVDTRYDRWFPTWARSRTDLRFGDWSSIAFRKGNNSSRTETLPLLKTEGPNPFGGGGTSLLIGGVSLASRENVARLAAPANDVSPVARRALADYGNSSSGSLQVGKGRFSFADARSVLAEAPAEARFESTGVELANANAGRTFGEEAGEASIGATYAGREFGMVRTAATPNGFSVGYEDRLVDQAYQLAKAASREDPERLLAMDPHVASHFTVGESRFVRLTGSGRWVELAPDDLKLASVADGWAGRAADYGVSRAMRFRFVDDDRMMQLLQKRTLSFGRTRYGTVRLSVADAPAGRPLQAIAGNRSLPVHVGGDEVRVRIADLPADLQRDPARVAELFDADDLGALTGAPSGATRVTLARVESPTAQAARESIDAGDPARLARSAAKDPVAARLVFDRGYRARLGRADELAASDDLAGAIRELDAIERGVGPTTDIVLRRAFIRIRQGRPGDLNDVPCGFGNLREGDLLLREVTARLNQASGTSRQGLERLRSIVMEEMRQPPRGGARPRLYLGDNGEVAIREVFQDAPGAQARLSDALKAIRNGDPLYVEHSPRFADIDWAQPLDGVLLRLVETHRGRLQELPVGDSAAFKPSLLYGTQSRHSYEEISTASARSAPRVLRVQGAQINDSCVNTQEKDNCQDRRGRVAYVLVAA